MIFLSTKYIHQLQAFMYNIINIYQINYITVNFRKKLWSCQAITHFLADYQTAILIKNTTKHHSRFLLIVYDRIELTSLKIPEKDFTAL